MNADTAWIYLVVSTSRQSESLVTQDLWARATADLNGWTITRSFQGSSSGRLGPRKILQDLLAQLRLAARTERPTRIMMTRLDRVGRGDTLKVLVAIDEIVKLGVMIHTREDGDIVIQRSSDIIKPFFRALTGGLENEARADKARAGHARRKAAGLHDGNAPYGVILVEGRPRAREPEANVVREIFQLRAQGYGLRRIARRIMERRPLPKTLRDGSTKPLLWDKSTIASMLRCETYRGVVVEETLFEATATVKITGPRFPKSTEGEWPLAGSVLCSCGRKLSGRMSGKGAWRHRYYVCYDHPARKHTHFRAEFVESAFVAMLDQIVASTELQRAYRSPKVFAGAMRERVADLRHALRDVDARRQNVLGNAELLPPSSSAATMLMDRLAELDSRRAQLEAEIRVATADVAQAEALRRQVANAADLLEALPTLWPRLNSQDQREIAGLVSGIFGGLGLKEDCTSRDVRFAVPESPLENVYVCLQM